MTAVIGILNKKGVALAADSAVTRTRGFDNTKVTKNGNKMIRLSDVLPICVMLTGNGGFMRTQWDIIVRHYRQHRGTVMHATVEACMHDFFRYIADHGLFREPEYAKDRIKDELDSFFYNIEDQIEDKYKNRDKDDEIASPHAFHKAYVSKLNGWCKRWLKDGVCPQFQDYTQQVFQEYTKEIFDEFIEQHSYDQGDIFKNGMYPRQIMCELREPLQKALMVRLTTRRDDDRDSAELVFSGYGKQQEYPSLVSAVVFEGFDNRVNYHVRPTDIICISDERPTAICPFAQKDVIHSVLRGFHRNFSRHLSDDVKRSFTPMGNDIFFPCKEDNVNYMDFSEQLGEVKTDDLCRHFFRQMKHLLDRNLHQWEKALEDYDLQSMAALAESLVDLTGFHRILTFQQEGVGGPVDVAVISKNDGFTWLNRKSWYHHKDVGGRYGKLGV